MFKRKIKVQPGVNIRFGIESNYFPSHGKLSIKNKDDLCDFSIIEPFNLPNVLDERTINMIFDEAKRQGFKPTELTSYKGRYFSSGGNLSNSTRIQLRSEEDGNLSCEIAVSVVTANQMNEEPFTVIYSFSDNKAKIPSLNPKFLSKLFEVVRQDRFIPISLESIFYHHKEQVDDSLEATTSENTEMTIYPKTLEENIDIPAVIRRRRKV